MSITPTIDGSAFFAIVREVIESKYVINAPDDWEAMLASWAIRPLDASQRNAVLVYGHEQIEVDVMQILGGSYPVIINMPQIPLINVGLTNNPIPAKQADRQYVAYIRTTLYSEFNVGVELGSLPEAVPLLNPLNTPIPSWLTAKSLRKTPQPRLVRLVELVNGIETREVVLN